MHVEEMVERANANEAKMDGTTTPVAEIIDAVDVAIAVWRDDTSETGVSYLVIKGAARLQRIAAGEESPAAVSWDAVKVIDRNMAIAAHHQLGDGEPLLQN